MALPPILFDDETMLVLDKPPGLPVVAGRAGEPALNTLVRDACGPDLKPAHRVDLEAGGPVVFARGKSALDFLSGQFQSKTASADWRAIVVAVTPEEALKPTKLVRDETGRPPESFELEWPLLPDPADPGRLCIGRRRQGRPALTSVRVEADFGRHLCVVCVAPTAPLHQVRVHLAVAGLPVLNDALYGLPSEELRLSGLKRGYKGREDERPLIASLALHAIRLTLRHPLTREPLSIESPLPKDFEVALKNLRKFRGDRRDNR